MALDKKSSYYDIGGIETIDIIKAKLTPEQYKGYLLGNIIKYTCRLNFKNDDSGKRDAEKIGHYNELLKAHTNDLQFHKETSFVQKAPPIHPLVLEIDRMKTEAFVSALRNYFERENDTNNIMELFRSIFFKKESSVNAITKLNVVSGSIPEAEENCLKIIKQIFNDVSLTSMQRIKYIKSEIDLFIID